ncbi:MAG: 3-hydroxybutyryl-CoA dehydrogenase, partial [Ignavibacteriae bacterium]
MEIKKVAVIGGGTMGNGITHVFAMKGYDVNLVEMKDELLDKSLGMISKNLDRQIKKEIIREGDKKAILSRISKVVGVKNVPADTDLVIEAIFEDKEDKLNVFKELDKIIKPDSIFASNTSSISITELSAPTRADKFIG